MKITLQPIYFSSLSRFLLHRTIPLSSDWWKDALCCSYRRGYRRDSRETRNLYRKKSIFIINIFWGKSRYASRPPPSPQFRGKGGKMFFFKLKFSVNSYHRIRKLFLFQWDSQQTRHICNWCREHDIHPHLEHEK